jgi:formylglycine-generating enzyme required for sulfatase activity
MHAIRYTLLLALALSSACTRAPDPLPEAEAPAPERADPRLPRITISDDGTDGALNWQPPEVTIDAVPEAKARATGALSEGRLFESAEDAIPLYLALRTAAPEDPQVARGLERALVALLRQGRAALADADDDLDALERSLRIASVARTVRPDSPQVAEYLDQVDLADQLWRLNAAGERAVRTGELGQGGELALVNFLEVLQLAPGQPRALQGVAATESALIRRAEDAAQAADFEAAERWLRHAERVREDPGTIADARLRIEAIRNARIASLRETGLADLTSLRGQRAARELLADVLRIAPPGDPAAADFRNRIDLATHYGLFRPGQVFSDALANSGRGPVMMVVPHGGFRMGATDNELGAADAEKPAHYVRFDRGFAMSRTPVTVGQFRRFVQATDYRPRATRRGHSIVYDERSGNFVRRSGVDWQSDYAGARAADSLPVLHVSVRDAEAYAAWLSEQTGHGYRLPSEAEYEYALRAGSQGRYPWGNTLPPSPRTGNLTGGNDVSPSGRRWNNAFVGYGDGYWGPAPAGSYSPNPWGLYDMGSNLSEWVSDCWHASYRRAPADGASWFNPGCRSRVVRGGSWASSPVQARAAWRASSDSDMTNARVGFRVVRGI